MEQCRLTGGQLPDAIKNAPEVQHGLELYYEAFFDLNTCRSIGMGAGPIPWTAIVKYAEMRDLSGRQTDFLIRAVQGMDQVYMEITSESTKS